MRSNTVPSAKTTSTPKIDPCNDPYLITLNPPAFVLALPPILHDPLLPMSSGNVMPYSFALTSKFSSMHPAWQVTISKYESYKYRAVRSVRTKNLTRKFVNCFYFVHPIRAYYDFVKDRYRSSYEPSVPPLRTHRQIMIVAVLQNCRDLFGRLWP